VGASEDEREERVDGGKCDSYRRRRRRRRRRASNQRLQEASQLTVARHRAGRATTIATIIAFFATIEDEREERVDGGSQSNDGRALLENSVVLWHNRR
jgi:hypothetical protein